MTDEATNCHDFRNQMGIVLGFSEMLLTTVTDDDQLRSDLMEIHKAAMAALELFERIALRKGGTAGSTSDGPG